LRSKTLWSNAVVGRMVSSISQTRLQCRASGDARPLIDGGVRRLFPRADAPCWRLFH
jgi:hypothetical protein